MLCFLFELEAWSSRFSCMRSVSVVMQMCVMCILHDLQFVMLLEDARGDHIEEAYSGALYSFFAFMIWTMTSIYLSHIMCFPCSDPVLFGYFYRCDSL